MPSLRGKKRKLQESICSTRTHNLRSREENLGEDSDTMISTEEKKVYTLETVSINEGNEPNDVSIKHNNCKNISQEQSMEKNESNVCVSECIIDNTIHSLFTNVGDTEVNATSSNGEESNSVKEFRSNGLASSKEKLTDVSDCLNNKTTVGDNNNAMVVETGSSPDKLNCDDNHASKSTSIVSYQSVEPAEPACEYKPTVVDNNIVDQVKSLGKERSTHTSVMEVTDTVNEEKCANPASQISLSTNNNGDNFNLNTGIPEQVKNNCSIDSVHCTINISQMFDQELEKHSKTLSEATSRSDLDVKLQVSDGSLNACTAHDNVMNGCAAQCVNNKILSLCRSETCTDIVTNKDVQSSSNLLPELLIQTEIAKDTILLAETSEENTISTLTKLNKETSECYENNEPEKTVPVSDFVNEDTLQRVPPSSESSHISHSRDKDLEISDKQIYLGETESQYCSMSDIIIKKDLKTALGVPGNHGMSGNDVVTSTHQMSSMQLNYDYTKTIGTGCMDINKDIQDKSCTTSESSDAIKSCNEAVLYINSYDTKSSSNDLKTTHTLGSGLSNASSLELSYSNENNVVKHNEGQTLGFVEQQSEKFHILIDYTSIQNSTADTPNRNTENINSSDNNRQDQVQSSDRYNTDRIQDQICDFSTSEADHQPTHTDIADHQPTQTDSVEPCGDKSSDLLNSQQSTQNFLESYEIEKADNNEMEIAEFERTFASAQKWSHEVVEKKKNEGTELVNGILAQLCEMNQELIAMKRKLDIVKREMTNTNNHPKPNTSKFFSKTNSNFSFFK